MGECVNVGVHGHCTVDVSNIFFSQDLVSQRAVYIQAC